MLELLASEVSVVTCLASAEALDALVVPGRAEACRTAPDELLLVSAAGLGPDVVRETVDRVAALDADAVVLDSTDGWTVWTLGGEDAREAFARLSELRLPVGGFVQGDVAHVPAKVLATRERIHLLVPATWGAHVRERILRAGLDVRQGPETAGWEGRAT